MRLGNLDAQVRAALFGQGQGGYMLSFDRVEALYQDNVGSSQAISASNPLGLVLDQKNGNGRGPELVNGGFATPTTYSNVTTVLSANSFSTNSTGNSASRSAVVIPVATPGAYYEVSYRIVSAVGGGVQPFLRDGSNLGNGTVLYTGSQQNGGTSVRFIAQVTGTAFNLLWVGSSSTGTEFQIDQISIKQVPVGNHFQQATVTARPTRQQDAQGYWYGNWDGADDIMVSLSAIPWAGSVYVTTFAGLYRTGAINAPRVVVETSDNINSINYASAVYSGIDGSNLTSRSKGTVAIDAKVAGNFGVKEVVVAEACPSAPLAAISNTGVSSGDITQSQGTGGFANYLEYVGGRGGTGGFNIQARMYALLRVNSVQRLNAPQIALGQAWIRSKMGA